MLLDDEDYLELCPFAGLGLPYGDVPSASSVAGIGKINGLWCVFIANDATVKAGLTFPISVTKTLRAQEVAIKNRLPCVYLVDNSGVFLPLQSGLFSDKNHAGRFFYNEAVMSAMKIPQLAVVCGTCIAGGAYAMVMVEEAVIVQRIGTVALAGPPLVKAATGEEVSPEDLGGAKLHTEVSGCIDYFASVESEAYQCSRNIITTFNFELPEESITEVEGPLYSAEELMGLAPKSYNYSLDIRLVEYRHGYMHTYICSLITIGTFSIFILLDCQHQVGIVANNGELTYEASLKGSHFVQLCDQRDIPLIFLQNTAPQPVHTLSQAKAEAHSKTLKAQGSMMSTVACASTPKITIVVGGCHGSDSYAMCGRAFDPNFLFLWPNARVSILAPGYAGALAQDEEETMRINEQLEEESSAFFSSGRIWDDGVILPQDTRKVLGKCLKIIKQKRYQLSTEKLTCPPLRM
ncbi:methylcrotonoyl-CoA carboxylase beta chain, mitochondrial-like [Pygocentrus nattereri]|uniref:methylcrotonoyl-CoA carboxylase beta chain, mitochondrial-like n=1 Tax=Pygocentrus nattereri TaxID=42514 RepID=UPI0018916267|nr:methylcrotonoyl-CoA carboxylase beta chain, mitochondrial-like [Pygocentrus nattereri]